MLSRWLFHTLTLAASSVANSSHPPSVTVRDGVLGGTTTALPSATASVNKFLGIPYAQSPPERFSAPLPPARWNMPRNATTFGPACLQQQSSLLADFAYTEPKQSEDCLYLNVFQPSGFPPDRGWSVVVWVHGGGLQFGSGGDPTYDGTAFAALEEVVFVSFNYRLSVFGFPGASGLPNFGFLDRRRALSWVQENIRKVIIFGESSGGISVDALLTTPSSPLPFRAAIIQSGTVLSNALGSIGQDAQGNREGVLSAFNCSSTADQVACMRGVPALALQTYATNQSVPTVVRDDNITYNVGAGQQMENTRAKVPVMVGSTANDGTIFTIGQTTLMAFINTIFGLLPQLIPQVAAAYAVGSTGISSESEAIAQIFTKIALQCPSAVVARQVTQIGSPAWRYLYNATFPNVSPAPGVDRDAYHASELPLVFSTYNMSTATSQQYALSNYMRGTWAQFAKDSGERT
ncbi:Putative carboxylesterase, type B, carboxylesterase type B, alpha/Beta hydrolase [Septoria linicola]|uniref:Carboxylesterase, type B, carboxylesterase type B, alpha/Beta hydrolase n=1 Tax=Septoria linicola TaxID=215465 RepID=A0A9Q9EK68_9PEZI|nr:putative carboxylesterase, type B, carboxylesterase type B, alpha/Beta hydrolase [Septoria linicola]USW54496.1 Putative carboxylesterase, type B, carboxylesterase type B, alpha/Beta hydrolase [Septoria linicola]